MQNISRLIENIDRMDSICRGKSNRFRPVAVNVMSHKANLVFFLNRAFNKHLCQESRVSKCRYHWLTNNSLGSLFTSYSMVVVSRTKTLIRLPTTGSPDMNLPLKTIALGLIFISSLLKFAYGLSDFAV